ncbi:MAG: zinc metalloprotease HtpX [Actinomycetota bacterium]|nr:zinc metalloprotease HtpX [Actinomycetota bacterium]
MVNQFPPDRGLTARMLFTMFLIGLLYVVFIAVLVAVGVSYFLIVLISGGLLFAQYFFSDRIALASMGAHEVDARQAPQLHTMIERLCVLADLPKPRVAVSDSPMPNAFAAGRNQKSSVVCVTSGLMEKLDEPELEGVLAHELSHIAHRDVAVMTIASFLGMLAGLITRYGFYSGAYGGGYGRNNDNNSAGSMIMVVVLASVVVYAVSFFLTRALSRYRELSADRAAATVTGRPSSLASALVKVSGEMARIPQRDLRRAEPLNAFFFAPALSKGFSLSSVFSTHPSLERRLEQLSTMESNMGSGA